MASWNKGKSLVFDMARIDELIADVRAHMTGPQAVEKYGVSRTTLWRILHDQGMHFSRPVPDRAAKKKTRKASESAVARLDRNARIVKMAATKTVPVICEELDMAGTTVRRILDAAGVVPIPYVRSSATVRETTPRPVAGDPVSAPIKRSKRKLREVDPLFFRCGKGHPLTRSNIVAGTEKSCLVCMKASQPMPFQFAPRRDELIAELLETIAREVDELTADLRPELAVAS